MKIYYLLFFAFATTQLPAQTIGVFFSQDGYQSGFFPERAIKNDRLEFMYREGARQETRNTLDSHYDFTNQSDFSFLVFCDDIVKLSFLNYLELGYSRYNQDLVLAGNIVYRGGSFAGPRVGYVRFFQYQINSLNFGIGRSVSYFKNEEKLWLKSIFSININSVINSSVSHSFSDDGPFITGQGESLLAQDRLYTLNVGLNTQHRIGYNISERFSVFTGFNLGIWLNPVSRSNQDYLDYLDTFEDEYGKLYKVRKGPFQYLGWQVGVVYHFIKSLK